MDSEDEYKSRTQKKRDVHALRDLGKELSELSVNQIKTLPVADDTLEAILAVKKLKKSALQRQFRHLANLLGREEDIEDIRIARAGLLRPHVSEVAAQHEAERWRDALLAGEDSHVTALIEKYPHCDRTHLRQLIRSAIKERELGKPPKNARLLFRFLRELPKVETE